MSSWRERTRKAKLDGVEFKYLSVRSRIGRRTVVHEFPGRDDAKGKDLGRRAPRFEIECVIVGDDYHVRLQDLRDVLESPSPWNFEHPYWGPFKVQLQAGQGVEITESTKHGGSAHFSLALEEVGLSHPEVFDDTGADLKATSTLAAAALDDEFGEQFVTKGLFDTLVGNVLRALNNAISGLNRVNGRVASKLNKVHDLSQAVQELGDQLETLRSTPGRISAGVRGLMTHTFGLIRDAELSRERAPAPGAIHPLSRNSPSELLLSTMLDLASTATDVSAIPMTTPQRILERRAIESGDRMMRANAVLVACSILGDVVWGSNEQAQRAVGSFVDAFEAILADPYTSDGLYSVVEDLRALVYAHLTRTAQSLPQVRHYTPPEETSTLVVAWHLLGDAKLETVITERNDVPDPGFLDSLSPLEVVLV